MSADTGEMRQTGTGSVGHKKTEAKKAYFLFFFVWHIDNVDNLWYADG